MNGGSRFNSFLSLFSCLFYWTLLFSLDSLFLSLHSAPLYINHYLYSYYYLVTDGVINDPFPPILFVSTTDWLSLLCSVNSFLHLLTLHNALLHTLHNTLPNPNPTY
jgi:hypothetical protein